MGGYPYLEISQDMVSVALFISAAIQLLVAVSMIILVLEEVRTSRLVTIEQLHLRKLEAVGLVSASVEVSADGKAMKYYEVAPFTLTLTPDSIRAAARTLSMDSDVEAQLQ